MSCGDHGWLHYGREYKFGRVSDTDFNYGCDAPNIENATHTPVERWAESLAEPRPHAACVGCARAETTDSTRHLVRWMQDNVRQEQRVKSDPESHHLAELDYEKEPTSFRAASAGY
jgi:hypothetical protein